MTTATFEATDGGSVSPFEVIAETVVAIETDESAPAGTFEPGDRVRIASDRALSVAGYAVNSSALGKAGVLDFLDPYSGWYVRPSDGTYGQYVDPQYLTKLTEVDLLREELAKVTAERDAAQESSTGARDLLNRQAAEFEAWKANLQEVALKAALDNEMCGVFDRVMEEVGLEGRERTISLRVEFSGAVYLEIEASSRLAARDQISSSEIRDAIANGYVPDFDWSVEDDG